MLCFSVRGADSLQWNASSDSVTADVSTWTVPDVLQRVAKATGWQIFLDPGITNRVSTKFSGKQPGDALQRLLGKFNYALIPDATGVSKLYVFRDSRDQATRVIAPVEEARSDKGRITNELVVTLKPGEKIEDLAKKFGAKIVGRSDAQNTYRLRFDDEKATDSARSSLENDSSVENIDSNYAVSRPDTAYALGGSGAPLNLTPKASPDGKYTVIGLIDSAVQPADGNFSQFLYSGVKENAIKSGGEPTHGTLMAEAILRAIAATSGDKATMVRILPVNVFANGEGQTTTYDIAVGVYEAVNGGAKYLSMSLGGYGDSTFLKNTLSSAVEQGVIANAAAGNDGSTIAHYPAAYDFVNSIGALNPETGRPEEYSNRHPSVDKWAPGKMVAPHGTQRYFQQGTSTATAIYTGVMASSPNGTPSTPGATTTPQR